MKLMTEKQWQSILGSKVMDIHEPYFARSTLYTKSVSNPLGTERPVDLLTTSSGSAGKSKFDALDSLGIKRATSRAKNKLKELKLVINYRCKGCSDSYKRKLLFSLKVFFYAY